MAKKKPKTVEEVAKNYEKTGSIKTIQERLKKGHLSTLKYNPQNKDTRNVYKELMKGSTIEVDDELINLIIENRTKFQHRFSAKIIIYTDKGDAELTIDGILPEQLYEINDYIEVGQTYTSQGLKTAMDEARKSLENRFGAIGGTSKAPGSGKVTVTGIEIEISFA